MAWLGLRLVSAVEYFISKSVEEKDFFDRMEFEWILHVENKFPQIKNELNQLMGEYSKIPEFKNLSDEQERIVTGNKWKTHIFYTGGVKIDKNCRPCLVTTETVENIPGMVYAFYSIFEPQTSLISHRGHYKGVLRYHLALQVPAQKDTCWIKVGESIRIWEEGKSLVFDDSFMH